MMKRKTLALIATATLCVGGILMAAEASAQEAIAPPASVQSAPPQDTGILASFFVRPAGDSGRTDQRFWFSSDYLFAFVRGTNVPPLVSTGPLGTDRTVVGTINGPGTSILFGDSMLNGEMRPGLRLGAGYWFGGDSPFGVEAGFIIVGGQATGFSLNSKQNPIIARPFTEALDGTQQAVLVAFPGASTGSIDARVGSGTFTSGSIDITEKAFDEGWFKLVAMVGYRFYTYSESVRVNQSLTSTDPSDGPGTVAITNDSFNTSNTFNGFDMGFRTQFFWDQFSLEVLTRCAFGDLQRRITINGSQTVTVPGLAPVTQSGGVLALATNSGSFDSHDWKVMPEFGLNFAWQIRPYVKLHAGYSFILLNGVARAADQIDTTINTNFLPPANLAAGGPLRPAFNIQRTDMWIQSINIGLEFTY